MLQMYYAALNVDNASYTKSLQCRCFAYDDSQLDNVGRKGNRDAIALAWSEKIASESRPRSLLAWLRVKGRYFGRLHGNGCLSGAVLNVG